MSGNPQYGSVGQNLPSSGSSDDQNFIILHGYTERKNTQFFPWLKNQLECLGYKVQLPELPDTDAPSEHRIFGSFLMQK